MTFIKYTGIESLEENRQKNLKTDFWETYGVPMLYKQYGYHTL